MFFHKDLDLYRNKKFRSLEYIIHIWDQIKFELIFIVGMINEGNITINIDQDTCHIVATTGFRSIYNKEIDITASHCVNQCEDFSVEVTINLVKSSKDFYVYVENCKLYFCKDRVLDDGFVEYLTTTNLNVNTIESFKHSFFINLSKEIQFAICRNIFHLNIEKGDSILAEIDSDFEILRTYAYLENIDIKKAIKTIDIKKHIDHENVQILKSLINKI